MSKAGTIQLNTSGLLTSIGYAGQLNSFTNSGLLQVSNGNNVYLASVPTVANSGQISIDASTVTVSGASSFTNSGAVTLTDGATLALTNGSNLTNTGTLKVGAGSLASLATGMTQTAGNTTVDGMVTFVSAALMLGVGGFLFRRARQQRNQSARTPDGRLAVLQG